MHEQQVIDWVRRTWPAATLREAGGYPVVDRLGDADAEYAVLREAVGLVVSPGWAQILAEGPDTVGYLHRRLTQAIEPLGFGEGAHALLLDGGGRMLADLLVYRAQEGAVLLTPRPFAEEVFEQLNKYVLMDQLELTRFWLNEPLIALAGPRAPGLVAALIEPRQPQAAVAEATWGAWMAVNLAGLPCRLYRDGRFAVPLFHVSAPPMALAQLLGALTDACRGAGGDAVGERALELVRIESGVTRHGLDTDGRTIPPDAALDDAVSFDKGCFPGQEVLAHIRNLGHPARVPARLTLDGEHQPPAGAPLIADAKTVGRLTSAVTWPGLGRTEALGSLRWPHRGIETGQIEIAEVTVTARVRALAKQGASRHERQP